MSKGIYLQTPLLVHQSESFELSIYLSESSDTEAKLELKLLELKPKDFISSVIHTYPSTSDHPKEELKNYKNCLAFEDQGKMVP